MQKTDSKQIILAMWGWAVLALAMAGSASAAPKETVLYSFKGGSDGIGPAAGLIADRKGNLYGTAEFGGAWGCSGEPGCGTVFKLSPPAVAGGPWTETVLHFFSGSDGASPGAGLIADNHGNLYGTTVEGGASGAGVVFKLSPPAVAGGAWTETVLHSFNESDGFNPVGLIAGSKGNFYGMSIGGGASECGGYGCGTVFELSPPAIAGGAWTETVLHSFDFSLKGSDAYYPNTGLIADSKGNLYGTTIYGGGSVACSYTCGTVFELSPPAIAGGTWTYTVLHNFSGSDGADPRGLIADNKGNLYGMTAAGGTANNGVVFELSPPAITGGAWTETVLHAFNGSDGAHPFAGLIADSNGCLFGTTNLGGVSGAGVVFALWPPGVPGRAWTYIMLHSFSGGSDGGDPSAGLIADSKGDLYGTAPVGGASVGTQVCGTGCGTVFKLKDAGFIPFSPWRHD